MWSLSNAICDVDGLDICIPNETIQINVEVLTTDLQDAVAFASCLSLRRASEFAGDSSSKPRLTALLEQGRHQNGPLCSPECEALQILLSNRAF